MGQGSSREREPLNGSKRDPKSRYYRPPYSRKEFRFDFQEPEVAATTVSTSVDRFDYLIIFPIVKGNYEDPFVKSHSILGGGSRMQWHEIDDIWRRASTGGTSDEKNEAVDELHDFFRRQLGVDTVEKRHRDVSIEAWLTTAREAIIEKLSEGVGLQLKLSSDGNKIYCRVRAPMSILEDQADRDDYRLEARHEIDPGSEKFWNLEERGEALELKEDKIMYTKEDATEILEKLAKANKIDSAFTGVYTKAETSAMWSRRVHVMERMADKVPIENRFPAYMPFQSQPHLRYLYRDYPSVRGRTIFRSKDRMFLTKNLLASAYDFKVLQDSNVIEACFALHDANRGDALTIESLRTSWVWYPLGKADQVGAPYVTHPSCDEGKELWFYLRPISQPLNEIRMYFGEKIALFYAWFGFYTCYLIFPMLLGVAMELLFYFRGYVDTVGHIDWFLQAFNLLFVLYNAIYISDWKVEEKAVALKWGTNEFEEEEKDRPQFIGSQKRRSSIDNEVELYFPEEQRQFRISLSIVAVVIVVLANVAIIGSVFTAEAIVIHDYPEYEFDGFYWIVALVQALQIPINSAFFHGFAVSLTDIENHQTETEYEDNLIFKTLLFQIFNNFGALIFTAFGKEYVFDTCESSCIDDMRQLLYMIIGVRLVVYIFGVAAPLLYRAFRLIIDAAAGEEKDEPEEELLGEKSARDDPHFLDELDLFPYDGTFDDYADAVMQFGYVNLFSVVLPLIPIISFAENLIKMRIHALKLCYFYRRPDVLLAEDTGQWANLMDYMSFLGVFVSIGILSFTYSELDSFSTAVKILIFLCHEQTFLVLKYFLEKYMSGEPSWIAEAKERNSWVESRYLQGFDDDGDQFELEDVRKAKEDDIDVDATHLGEFHSIPFAKLNPKKYENIKKLRAKRRSTLRDITTFQDELTAAYDVEVLDSRTGMGQTKDGQSLGMIEVFVAHIRGADCEDMFKIVDKPPTPEIPNPPSMGLIIKVHVKTNTNQPAHAFRPDLYHPDTETGQVAVNHSVVFGKSLGPILPIKHMDADVVFDLFYTNSNVSPPANVHIATASIPLYKLRDQQTHELKLQMSGPKDQSMISPGEDALIIKKLYLYCNVAFKFSKIEKLRGQLVQAQSDLEAVERLLARIQTGKKMLGDESNVAADDDEDEEDIDEEKEIELLESAVRDVLHEKKKEK